MTADGSLRAAVLPAGALNTQPNVSVSPSTSLEPEPSRVTVAPSVTDWSGPASATGGVLPGAVTMTTSSGALSSLPSLTTS